MPTATSSPAAPSTPARALFRRSVTRARGDCLFGRVDPNFRRDMVFNRRLRFSLHRGCFTKVIRNRQTFRCIVTVCERTVGFDHGHRFVRALTPGAQGRFFFGPLCLFDGPFGASTFTPLLVFSWRRNGGGDNRGPVEGQVGILRFDAASSFFVKGRAPYPDARRSPIPVQNPLARRLPSPRLGVNEINAFVTALVS